MRNHYSNALEVVMATAVLHNLSVIWGEPEPEDIDNSEEDEDDDQNGVGDQRIAGSRANIRLEATALRDTLMANMARATVVKRGGSGRESDLL
jgi:hypothetical protein